jgi:manganese/zinc/iron transport system permease protein
MPRRVTTGLSGFSLGALSALALLFPGPVVAGSLVEHAFEWPTWSELARVLTLQDYNTRVVIIGTTLLGLAAGLAGTFLLLRKRALLSDALSHATLPGIALAFMLMSMTLGDGKHLLGLIAGAAVFSVIGTASVLLIQRYSRLKDDAALGIVLSVYFGLGIALLGLATRMESGNAAGLSSFIYGKTASMLFFDAVLIGLAALFAALCCIVFFKEFALICFDADYAAAQGWPVARLDFFMMTLVVIVTVIGLQAVGLILVVALLIIPPSTARFWTHRLPTMLALSGLFGAISGLVGSGLSALMANLPAGAVIVLTASALFGLSLFFGTKRGLLRIGLERLRLRRKITRENVLRELYEWFETHSGCRMLQPRDIEECRAPNFPDLLGRRSWSSRRLRKCLARLQADGLVTTAAERGFRLTAAGTQAAREVVRKHRLWEAYLITHADVAPGHVDWGADQIEHVLDQEMIAKLERMLPEMPAAEFPGSPHDLDAVERRASS